MALIMKKATPSSRKWYEENRQRLSEKRKGRYAEDLEYRQRALEASRKYRRGEQTLPIPPDAPISFAEASKRVGVSTSTLHAWRRKKFFPEPTHYNHRLWFTENQVLLLGELKEFFRVYGKRTSKFRHDQQKLLVASIAAKWN
jgi:MerR HTH family regulatory protein